MGVNYATLRNRVCVCALQHLFVVHTEDEAEEAERKKHAAAAATLLDLHNTQPYYLHKFVIFPPNAATCSISMLMVILCAYALLLLAAGYIDISPHKNHTL